MHLTFHQRQTAPSPWSIAKIQSGIPWYSQFLFGDCILAHEADGLHQQGQCLELFLKRELDKVIMLLTCHIDSIQHLIELLHGHGEW